MRRRRLVAIAVVGAAAGLFGCADDSGGPRVAPPPSPSPETIAAKAPGPPAGRAARGVTARPGVQAGALKTMSP